ncbi:MAG: cytoplasmic protein [Cyanobacteria bacterium P01_C01_bin.89]
MSANNAAEFPSMPEDVKAAHQFSIRHRPQLLESDWCGCFYCCKIFNPSAIDRWIDEPGGGETALCPYCGIDSVIGDRSEFPITLEFMQKMHQHWF